MKNLLLPTTLRLRRLFSWRTPLSQRRCFAPLSMTPPEMDSSRRVGWLIVVAVMLFAVAGANAKSLDRRMFDAVHEGWKHPVLDVTMPVVNEFGEGNWIAAGTVLTILLGKGETRDTGILLATGFGSAAILTESIKLIARRPRPLNPEDRVSMPSGHTTAAFAVATVLGRRYPRWRIPLYGMASGVGLARIYLGRHYPSDVLVGAAIGVLVPRAVLHYETEILSVRF